MQTQQQDVAYLGGPEVLGGCQRISKGKVRDIYALDDEHMAIVTTDRISAFDVVMAEGIPHKGRVLTAITTHWFERAKSLVNTHLVSTEVEDFPGLSEAEQELLRGRIMIVRRAQVLPVEWVIRGYIAGSGWKDYQRSGAVCGIPLPAGLQLADRLEQPILTPTTKSDVHDEPMTEAEVREELGDDCYERVRSISLDLFALGTQELAKLDILLADTKFEFGTVNGELTLIDEILTPDSSRFWPEESWAPGSSPPSYDKQILRDYLETLDWNKQYPPPDLDPAILQRVGSSYIEICHKITGAVPAGTPGAPTS